MTTLPHGAAIVVLASWSACAEPQPLPDPPREIATAAPKQAPDVAPTVARPTPPPAPVVVRDATRTTMTATAPIEDLAVVRSGFAWIEDSGVRVLLDADAAPRVIATTVDPHGLASDGERICWLGDEHNGCHDLAKDVAVPLPRVAGPGEQEALAFGDVLHARSRPDALWRFEGDRVARMSFHPDPAWKLLPGLGAGPKVAFVPAIEPQGRKWWLVRVPARGKAATIAVPKPLGEGRWAVDARGAVALVGDGDDIMLVDPGKTTPRAFAKQADVQRLCWCGAEVCTISGGVLRRHPARGEPSTLAEGLGEALRLSCGFGRIAWTERTGETARIVAIPSP